MVTGTTTLSALTWALILVASACAQNQQPKIAGRVTQADSGSPLEGATVTLVPPYVAGIANLPSARTDRNGFYRFDTVVDGTYSISASADGFVTQDFARDASPEGAFIRIDSTTRIHDIDFHLMPQAVIRGKVVDVAGKPLAQIPVVAVRQDAKVTLLHGSIAAVTDINGNFTLKGLPPGTYLICANGPAGYGASSDPKTWYRETWFVGSTSRAGASPISLRGHEERSDVRIVVEREMRYRVVVWPSGPTGEPAPDRYDVTIEHRSHNSMKEADGSYVIPNIPAGHYTLTSTAWMGTRYIGQGTQDFDVVNADVSVHLQIGALGQIDGTVQWIGAPAVPSHKALFRIESEEGAAQGVLVDSHGHFEISDVLPGKYQFQSFEDELIGIRSVACEGKEVHDGFVLKVGDREKISGCKVVLEKTSSP